MKTTQTANPDIEDLMLALERLEQVDSLIQAASIRAPEILTVAADLPHEAVDALKARRTE